MKLFKVDIEEKCLIKLKALNIQLKVLRVVGSGHPGEGFARLLLNHRHYPPLSAPAQQHCTSHRSNAMLLYSDNA